MADGALFIRWGATAAGRERNSTQLFMESLRFLSKLVEQGRVASVEPFFLEPHGGDLDGFFLVRGDHEELNKIRGSGGRAELRCDRGDHRRAAERAHGLVHGSRPRGDGSRQLGFVADQAHAVLVDHPNPLGELLEVERVAFDHDDVGTLAGCERAKLVRQAHQLGRA